MRDLRPWASVKYGGANRPQVLQLTCYAKRSRGWRDLVVGSSATRRLFETGKSRFRGLDVEAALELLAILNAAPRLGEISPLKSVGLHPLKGDRRGQWAITVNGPWRICFRFADGHAYEVEIIDYH
jgi:proteic killer suppression protein